MDSLGSTKNKGRQGFGLVQLFTGDGKGKTTAALGEAVRAAGAGKRVGIVFFDKGGTHYSERAMLSQLGIQVFGTGRDRIDASGRFDFSLTDQDKQEAARGLERAEQMLTSGDFDLVILDEINSTAHLKMIEEQALLTLLQKKRDDVEVILTGRNAPQAFRDQADLITEMTLKKHYFYSGTKAREGLDF